ncbi:MAG: DOMON domain-containing protein [Candidatus Fermentibacter sp.]|nr:DOMON domain-containing protein [Candidatus Fermentibacter sp.]
MRGSLLLILSCLILGQSSCSTGDDAAPAGDAAPPPPDSAGGARSVQREGFLLSWTVEGAEAVVTMSAPTTGWVAAGFHTEGAMQNAQIVMGWVDGDAFALRDDFGTGFTTHAPDTSLGGSDDLVPVSGTEEDGRTTIVFRMPLDSGDVNDRVLVPGEPCRALVAYGNDGDDDFTSYHAWAAIVEIEI